MDWGNVSLLEIVWTGMAALALVLWLGLIGVAIRDAAALRGRASYRSQGMRAQIVRSRLWTAGLDALVQAGLVALGVSAMVTPPPLRSINQEQAMRSGLLLILVEGILLAKALVSAISRARIDQSIRAAVRKEKKGPDDATA